MASETESTSTTAAALSSTQTRQTGALEVETGEARQQGEGEKYRIGPGVVRSVRGRPYERRANDPLYRPLQIYVLDPSASRLEGSIATVNVPYEPLEPGCRGRVFETDSLDGGNGKTYQPLNLNDQKVLLNNGRTPSPADPLFHQQMVYAVASLLYAVFKAALGRHPSWGFEGGQESKRLRLRPYASLMENAYYDKSAGEICFGYYHADPEAIGRNLPNGVIFTSLSHDVIVHETTHALLDGLRAKFSLPTGADVLAFHEGFADLMAILQRLSYPAVVEQAIGKARGDITKANILMQVAQQFGETVQKSHSLRTALDPKQVKKYRPDLEPHELGGVLLAAIFDAFDVIYRRRIARYLRIATGGTGVLPPGDLHPDLQTLLAREVSKLASQFQMIAIRAVDYCPPVDIELGEYLRAVITADHDLVPDDRLAYREALIDAFGSRGILPREVQFLSEDSLLWCPPTVEMEDVTELTFASLRFAGDPACPASAGELRRQAGALGRLVTDSRYLEEFGLVQSRDPRLKGDTVELPVVESIRSSRRVGPDGQIVFDLVAEVTQTLRMGGSKAGACEFIGGCTVIIGPKGEIRYLIRKSVLNEERLARQQGYLAASGYRFWSGEGGCRTPLIQPFRLLHESQGGDNPIGTFGEGSGIIHPS